jgi:hypothetical protein
VKGDDVASGTRLAERWTHERIAELDERQGLFH